MHYRRISAVIVIFLFIYVGLLINIFYLQIINGEKLARQAAAMRNRQIELKEYPRGEIFDCNLLPLTSTSSSNAVYCLPGVIARENQNTKITSPQDKETVKQNNYQKVAQFLGRILKNKSAEEIYYNLVNADRKGISFIRIESDLTNDEMVKINNSNISGIVVAPIIKRYRTDGFCAHLLGYVSGSNNSEGKAGLELIYNNLLKDNPVSKQLVSVLDARGMVIQGLMFKVKNEQDQKKAALVLTIDKRIQEIVEQSMDKRMQKGAVVVMNVNTKEILAMASRPDFNPYDIERTIECDDKSSLMNRALSSYYPGSLFKILLATAALEEKVVRTDDKFNCTGEYVFNDQVTISCWKEEGHGELTFAQAFAYSCNPSFIETGLRLGREKLLNYVNQLHVTNPTLIGYGKSSTESYVAINPGEPALGNACLGQEGVMLTPLQVASLFATIADNGLWAPPSIVRYTIDSQGKKNLSDQTSKKRVVSSETARIVKKLLEKVVAEGTGKTAAIPEVKVAGKTATSQTGKIVKDDEEILNTWFGGYFPANNPEWAIVVLVEEGTSGAESAAPVFRDIARGILKYYSPHIQN